MAVIGHVLSYECTSVVYEMRIMVGLVPVKVRGSLVAVYLMCHAYIIWEDHMV